MYYNEQDKPILVLNEKRFNEALEKGKDNLMIVWDLEPYPIEGNCFYQTDKDIKEILTKNISNTVTNNAKLYFTKKSKIPRFKLQETEYKRVIKPDKADHIVINEIPNIYITKEYTIFKNSCAIFFVDSVIIKNYAGNDLNTFLNRLETINNRSNFDATPIYSGKLNYTSKSNAFIFDIYDKYSTKSIVLDSTLNKVLDNLFSTITEDDLKTIYQLLTSSDKSSVEMGLKLLSNTSISNTPYLIYSILMETYFHWRYNDAKNSVSVKNMLNAINFSDFYRSNDVKLYYNIYRKVKDIFGKEPLEEEITLIKKYFTNKEADNLIARLNDSLANDNTNPLFPKIIISSE